MSRYTGVTDEDLSAMLGAIGVDSLEDLFADIPGSVRLRREIEGVDTVEHELLLQPVGLHRTVPGCVAHIAEVGRDELIDGHAAVPHRFDDLISHRHRRRLQWSLAGAVQGKFAAGIRKEAENNRAVV